METLPQEIRSLGVKRQYRKKSLFFSAGEESRGFFYVLAGEIRVFRMDEKAREVEVARFRPGDFFGEAAAFASATYPAFAEAICDSEVLYFDREVFLKKLEKNPALARYFLNLLARKCLILNERIESLGLLTVRQRLAQYLLAHCSGQMACLIELSIKKAELARLLGTASETLSRNLRALERHGLIEVCGRSIRVKDCFGLRREIVG